jgi:transposase
MFYAGIDAHAKYLQVAVLDNYGRELGGATISTADPSAIAEYLAVYRPLQVVVESCPFWPWLRDRLERPGVRFHLAHAKELRAIAQHAQKNDQIDAALLARMLFARLIPPAHAPKAAVLEQLRLVRHYAWLTRTRTLCANRIHAQLHQSGIQLPRERLLTRKGRGELVQIAQRLSTEQRRLIRTHLLLIDNLSRLLAGLRCQIRRRAAEEPAAALLQTMPGIGPYWSLLLSAALTPIERFRTREHLVSYAGLAPITRSSGGHVAHGPLPKAANRWVRGAFVAAAMSHLRHARNSSISKYYERSKPRLGWKKARIAAARKLARTTFTMLKSQRAWRD